MGVWCLVTFLLNVLFRIPILLTYLPYMISQQICHHAIEEVVKGMNSHVMRLGSTPTFTHISYHTGGVMNGIEPELLPCFRTSRSSHAIWHLFDRHAVTHYSTYLSLVQHHLCFSEIIT